MDKKILVAGCGRSGVQATNLLLSQGASVLLYDSNENIEKEKVLAQLSSPVEIVTGELTDAVIAQVSECIISPGISLEMPFAVALKEHGIDPLSEIEASYRYEKGQVIGITGTNGKTTTTTLTGEIMRAWKGDELAFTAGNIGIPYSKEVLKTSEESWSTLEISSFQLETATTFHPHISAILNITPDHLDRHHTMDCYASIKMKITMNQTEDDYVVLNYCDPRLRAFGLSGIRPHVLWFSDADEPEEGYFLRDNTLYKKFGGKTEKLMTTDETSLVGRCNYENILAAFAITEAAGVPQDVILNTVRNFKAVSHRIEYTATVNGVRYYDDSKGTNPDAAIQGIRAMTTPTVLIGGGYDKHLSFDEWIEAFDGKVKELILMGVTKDQIAECARAHGFNAIVFVNSMEEAVAEAYKTAEPGDSVLLSPACASWGMFDNFEQRGDIFKELVRKL